MTAYTLTDLLRTQATSEPERIAIVAAGETVTYGDLWRRAQDLASSLITSGVEPGAPVGLALHKSIDAIVAAYGIMAAGAAYVPIDVFAPWERSIGVIENTSMRFLVSDATRIEPLIDKWRHDERGACLRDVFLAEPTPVEGLRVHGWSAKNSLPAITDTHLAYILHTSGSTGRPKGVAISHRNALCFVEVACEFWNITACDRLCSQAPLHFDLSVFDLYCAAARGASVVIVPEFFAAFPKKMASLIDEAGITIWNSVVSTLTLMMEKGKPEAASFSSLRAVIFSGEVMPIRQLRILLEHMKNAQFFNVYGQTEANSSVYFSVERDSLPSDDGYKLPLGKPLPNFSVFLVDGQNQKISEPGIRGEILVRAHTVAQGYWGNPELSHTKFVIDPCDPNSGARVYRTGDLACWNDEGDLVFQGRTDDMIKSRGYRIELGEIDLALLACDGVEAAATIAIPDDEIGNRLIAFVTGTATTERIEQLLRQRLPKYMIPEQIRLRDSMPRTSTNKIDRNMLRAEVTS